jgi:hypothetical protein
MVEVPKEVLGILEEYYGVEAQVRQAIGECGEFIGIAHNFDRSRRFKTRDVPLSEMLEEAVDVFFMMQQMRSFNPVMFDELCALKLEDIIKKSEKAKEELNRRELEDI